MADARKVNFSFTDLGELAVEVTDGDESQNSTLIVKGGAANPVQVTVSAGQIDVQTTVDGKTVLRTISRKTGT
jgi:hypothetical protein